MKNLMFNRKAINKFLDKLPAYIERKRLTVMQIISTITCIVSAKFWQIKLGKSPVFYGKTFFFRAANSQIKIGEFCRFRSSLRSNFVGINRACSISTMKSGSEVLIGNACGLSGTVIASSQSVTLGNNVLCGGNVTIVDTDFHGISVANRNRQGESAPVVIEDDVWLGLNVVVLKGVRIGHGTIIAAGSVVVNSIPPMVIAGGTPAIVLKEIKYVDNNYEK
jgi:acetyltransferase-like isoleucine patch superfamily enzyme